MTSLVESRNEMEPPVRSRPAVATLPCGRPGRLGRFLALLVMSIASLAASGGAVATAAVAADDGCANNAIRVDQGSTFLPDCRAYEQVSPVDKNYGDVQFGADYLGGASASSAGEATTFCSSSVSLGESPRNAICTAFVSSRDATAQRWNTAPTTPRNCSQDPNEPGFSLNSTSLASVSPDMTKAVIMQPEGAAGCPFAPIDPAAPTPSTNLYLRDFADPSSFDLLTPAPGVQSNFPKIDTRAGSYFAADEDFSNIVIQSDGQQTSEVPADGISRPFEWTGGTLRLIARDPANVPFAGPSQAINGFQNGVSSDGDRIFFYSPTPVNNIFPDSGSEIYMRAGGTQTYHVTASECTSSCGSSEPKVILSATPDGSKVVFRSAEKLTDHSTPSGENAYLYTHSEDPATDENLTLLSPDADPSDGIAANVRGFLGMGDDGDDVYFAARGQLVSGQTGTPDDPNDTMVYRSQANAGNPIVSFLGAIQEPYNWSGDPNPGSNSQITTNRHVTPGGDALAIGTQAGLDPTDTNGDFDAYRWSQDDGWACLSCVGIGGAGGGASAGPMNDIEQGGAPRPHLRRPISDDGTRVSFNSFTPLVPQDTNGVRDVYQWVAEGTGSCQTATVGGGCLYLISSGKSPSASAWIGSSADGEDVFFTTAERLVGWDTDLNADIYDARVGGGFSEPVAPAPKCGGDECQGPATVPPALTGGGSGSFRGDGNRQAAARSSISGIRRLSSSARSALARGVKVRLRLRVNRSGTVTVAGRARVGGKSRRVVSSSAKARKAGSVSVPFALSKRALSELRRRGSLAVALTVRFKDARPKVVKLTLRSAASRKGGAR